MGGMHLAYLTLLSLQYYIIFVFLALYVSPTRMCVNKSQKKVPVFGTITMSQVRFDRGLFAQLGGFIRPEHAQQRQHLPLCGKQGGTSMILQLFEQYHSL